MKDEGRGMILNGVLVIKLRQTDCNAIATREREEYGHLFDEELESLCVIHSLLAEKVCKSCYTQSCYYTMII
jgi:hypothetical protein